MTTKGRPTDEQIIERFLANAAKRGLHLSQEPAAQPQPETPGKVKTIEDAIITYAGRTIRLVCTRERSDKHRAKYESHAGIGWGQAPASEPIITMYGPK